MIIAFVLIVSHLINGTISYKECYDMKFGPKACYQARSMHDLGKKACDLNGKKFDGFDCK